MYNVIMDRNIMDMETVHIATKLATRGLLIMSEQKWGMMESELRERNATATDETKKFMRHVNRMILGQAEEIDVMDKMFNVSDYLAESYDLSSEPKLLLPEEGVYILFNPYKVTPDEVLTTYRVLFLGSEAGGEHVWIDCRLEKELDENEVCD